MKNLLSLLTFLAFFGMQAPTFSEGIYSLSRTGDIYMVDLDKSTATLVEQNGSFKDWVDSALVVDSATSNALIINTIAGTAFLFDFDQPGLNWQRIDSLGRDAFNLAYDKSNRAILASTRSSTDTEKIILSATHKYSSSDSLDIGNVRFIRSNNLFRDAIPGGVMSQSEAAAQVATPSAPSNNVWNLAGASETFLTYAQLPTPMEGKQRNNAVLIINKSSRYRSMKVMPKVSTTRTYDDAVVIQQLNDQVSDAFEQRTQNIWIYSKTFENFVPGELEQGALILQANANFIYYGIMNDLKRVRYDATGCGKPELIATLPEPPIYAFVIGRSAPTSK